MRIKDVLTHGNLFTITVLFIAFLSAAPLKATEPRRIDPVIVKGDRLENLAGVLPERISVYSFRSGRWEAIPFQIDERMEVQAYNTWTTRRTILTYAMDSGPKAASDPDPSFDLNDELTFMASGAGDRSGGFPPGASTCEEIELKEPDSDARSYVYACQGSQAVKSDLAYVTVNGPNEIEGSGYVVSFPDGNPVNFNGFQIRDESGLLPDPIDRFKMGVKVSLLWGVAGYPLSDADFTHYLRGTRAGPIRVIREFESVLETFAGAQIRTYNHVYFYPSHIEYEMDFRGAANWGKSINRSDLVLALDLDENGRGMRFYSQNNSRGELVDGRTNPSELYMDYGPTEWAAVAGEAGNIVVHLGLDSRTDLYKDLYYADNDDKGDPPEEDPGMVGKFGYIVRNMQKAGFDQFPVRFAVYGEAGQFSEQSVRPLVQMYDSPLEVSVNRHEFPAVRPSAAAVPDDRKERPQSTFAEQRSSFEFTRFLSPGFIMDPNLLGTGPGVSYVDVDFLKTGSSMGFFGAFTDRGYQEYDFWMSELRFIEGVDAFKIDGYYNSFPASPFYGIGNDTSMNHKTYYWIIQEGAAFTFVNYFGRIYGADIQVGYRRVYIEPGIEPMGEDVPSFEEKFGQDDEIEGFRWGPPVYGRKGGYHNGVEVSLYRDMRSARYLPKFGNYQEFTVEAVTSAMGSDYDYARATLDLRGYWHPDFLNPMPLLDDVVGDRRTFGRKFFGPNMDRTLAGRILLTRLIADEIFYEGEKILDVPFYELTYMGDDENNRGYSSRRFRDNDMAMVSLEYRWRFWRFQDAALFWDCGMVMNDMFMADNWENELHHGYGASWRIHVPPQIIVTLELGFSDENSGLMYQANVAF